MQAQCPSNGRGRHHLASHPDGTGVAPDVRGHFQSQSYGSKKDTIRITAKFGKRAATAQVVPLGHVQLLRTKTIFVIGHRTEVVACVRLWRFNLWTPGFPIA